MKTTLYVPIMSSDVTFQNRMMYKEMLTQIEVDKVFLVFQRCNLFKKDRKKELKELCANLRFFEENGFDIGVWVQAFGFGNSLNFGDNTLLPQVSDEASYTYLKSVTGAESTGQDALCPLNDNFVRDYCNFITDIASVSPKSIMLDDDLCLSVRPGIGCFCDSHLKLFYEKIEEKPTFDSLTNLIFTGGKNKYRSAWLHITGDTLRNFCKSVRIAVDKVDKSIRVGLCAGYTSWDIEGATAIELAKILAGETKPFLRFTGAPYWVSKDVLRFEGQRLNTVIECARMQEKWCRDTGIEIFSEADSWPRPRYHVPASHIDCFDIAMRASGGAGVLKYMMDYISSPHYEQGYFKAHKRNMPLYDFIEKHFDNKKAFGVKLFEKMRRIENAILPKPFCGEKNVMSRFFSPAAALLTAHSIPVTYEDSDCMCVFGDNALHLDKLPQKLIIDFEAAKILTDRGFDVGLESWLPAPKPLFEHFKNEKVNLYNLNAGYYNCKFKKGAEILSNFESPDAQLFPSAAKYSNSAHDILILAFDAYAENQSSGVFLSYKRQEQLLDFIENIPYIKGVPGVYQIFKKNETGAAILFLNLSEDAILPCEIKLDKKYISADIFGDIGELCEDTIYLKSEIPAYGSIAVTLK